MSAEGVSQAFKKALESNSVLQVEPQFISCSADSETEGDRLFSSSPRLSWWPAEVEALKG